MLAVHARRRTAAAEVGHVVDESHTRRADLLDQSRMVDGHHHGGGVPAVDRQPLGVEVLEHRHERRPELHLVGPSVVRVIGLLTGPPG